MIKVDQFGPDAATTPHTDNLYTQTDLRGPLAVIMGSEQYGLSEFWMK